jgi:hypothetical protein
MCYVRLGAQIGFWIVAIGFSLWYGKYATEALEVSEDDKDKIAKNAALRWHQRWLNFLGSFVGWSLGYMALQHLSPGYKLGTSDAILMFVAFIGMTGHLPFVVKHIWRWKFPWSGE